MCVPAGFSVTCSTRLVLMTSIRHDKVPPSSGMHIGPNFLWLHKYKPAHCCLSWTVISTEDLSYPSFLTDLIKVQSNQSRKKESQYSSYWINAVPSITDCCLLMKWISPSNSPSPLQVRSCRLGHAKKVCEPQLSGLCMHVILTQGAPVQTVCYVYVCDLTFCVSLVVHLGRLRVTVSEFEVSRGGCVQQSPLSLLIMWQ